MVSLSNKIEFLNKIFVKGGFILKDANGNNYIIGSFILTINEKNNEVIPWKKFNSNMAISIEYNLEY